MTGMPSGRPPQPPTPPGSPAPAHGDGPTGPSAPTGRTEPREPDCELTSYRELATLLENLPMLMREARRSRQLSGRTAGAEIGISVSTISRVENGAECSLSNAVAVLRWLDRQGGDHA